MRKVRKYLGRRKHICRIFSQLLEIRHKKVVLFFDETTFSASKLKNLLSGYAVLEKTENMRKVSIFTERVAQFQPNNVLLNRSISRF